VKVGVQSRLTKAGDLYFVNSEPITLLLMKSRNAWRGNAALFGQDRDLRQRLRHHTQQDVVADFHHARQLALTDIGNAAAEQGEVGFSHLELRFGARGYHRQQTGLDHLGVAGYRCRQHRDATSRSLFADRG